MQGYKLRAARQQADVVCRSESVVPPGMKRLAQVAKVASPTEEVDIEDELTKDVDAALAAPPVDGEDGEMEDGR